MIDDSEPVSANLIVDSTRRPVARALFPSPSLPDSVASQSSMPVLPASSSVLDDQFAFSAQQARKKSVKRKVTPLVDSSLRRCTRSAAKRDGFKPVLHQLPLSEPRKKKPRAKPLLTDIPAVDSVPAGPAPSSSSVHGESPSGSIPPPTPIRTIQIIGQDLGIPSEKLSVALLMADKADDV